MSLSLAEKAIFLPKKMDFQKVRYRSVQNVCLVHAHKLKVGLFLQLPIAGPFLAPFLHFSRSFYSRYLMRSTVFLAALKGWLLIIRKALKWDMDIKGHFTTTIAPKLITLVCKCYLRMPRPLCGHI